MSQFSAEAEAELQSLLRQLLKSIKDRISGAPSIECAEEILLHLEETDKNFHKYSEMNCFLDCYHQICSNLYPFSYNSCLLLVSFLVMNLLSTCGSMWKALWEQSSRRRPRAVPEERDMLLGLFRTPWSMLLQGRQENLESMYGLSLQCP